MNTYYRTKFVLIALVVASTMALARPVPAGLKPPTINPGPAPKFTPPPPPVKRGWTPAPPPRYTPHLPAGWRKR